MSELKYFGGKSRVFSKINFLIPQHNRRFSPFFGAGGVEFRLDTLNVSEVFNDIDGLLINFYQVLQTPQYFREFVNLVELTPFSQAQFDLAKLNLPIEHFGLNVKKAWQFYICNRLSVGGSGGQFAIPTKRLRRGINEQVSAYLRSVDGLPEFHERLKYIQFMNMDFKDFITRYDGDDCFFLMDPPYLPETRVGGTYNFELSREDHIDLLEICSKMQGKFLLHGYDSDLYKEYENKYGWKRHIIEMPASSSFSKSKPKRQEIIWMNYDI